MVHLIAYLNHPSSAARRALQSACGVPFEETVLPIVSPPMTAVDAERAVAVLRRTLRAHEIVLIQPTEAEIPPMGKKTALRVLQGSQLWADYAASVVRGRDVSFICKEHPRCWVIIVETARAGIPPGAAFLVDKHGGAVLPRRWVDATDAHGQPL